MMVRPAAGAATTVLLSAALTGSFAPIASGGQPTPTAPPGVTIAKIDAWGSGCRRDTATIGISDDRRAFTVIFSEYTAQVGPESRIRDQRRDCRLRIRVSVPAGYTFGITGVDYRGYAQLAEGSLARHRSSYDFGGGPLHPVGRRSGGEQLFRGPMESNWQGRTAVEGGVALAPCGPANTVNIHSELSVRAVTPSRRMNTSYITMDSADGEFQNRFSWEWRKCDPRPR